MKAETLDRAEDEERSGNSEFIQSVVITGQIIEALAAAGQPMRLTALASQLGEPKAKMHRHLSTLKHLGFVDQDAKTETYRLGLKLVYIGQSAIDQFDLRRLAEPYMSRLRDLTRQTIVLSTPANGDAIINAVVESPNLVTISVRLGYRLPAHASAQGRLNLAFAPAAVQQRILARKLQAFTPRTLVDPVMMRERLAQIRQQLFDVSMDETLLGISAVAAPILNFDNELVGAVAIVGTTQDVHEPVDPEQLKLLRSCTKAISLRLNSTAYEGLGIPNLREFIFD
ncbi:IclR family transcriptional regulator [Bradyrhizobium sp. dw_411]|uniref:IclR family transcriptional regulator n=1 Tax=Bradyrhizobium sp. dw_411 TaxID=2720082 RepID=UPI001BCDD7D9|nr:IclR family transcriptional regulator [Bradyrhizobium sp. dw_411]